jgi:hypothetical protein
MKTGKLFYIVTISTMTPTITAGRVTAETWSTPVERRASVEQVDGTRYLNANELADREVYKIELWDEGWSNNIRIVYDSKTLYPICPVTRSADRSCRTMAKIIVATKT